MRKQELIIEYLKGYEQLINTLDPLPREVFDYKPSESKWSIREIVAHIVDCEINAYIRFRMAIAENGNTVTAYNQDKWASSLLYEIQSIDDDLELFKFLRKNTYKLFINIPDSIWNNYIIHPERGKITLIDYLREVVEHIGVHVNQMLRNYDDWVRSA
jgi:hypothetical protein